MQIKTKNTPKSARLIAIKVLSAVIEDNRSLTDALASCDILDDRDRAFCKELCYGTLRWYVRLNSILSLLLKKPFKTKDTNIRLLALTGLYQLIYLQTPNHAAVSETVNTCIKLKKVWAKNTLNAVLRRFLRERSSIEARVDTAIHQRYSHPPWLIERIQHDWDKELVSILNGNNTHPPMSIRVNQQTHTRDQYVEELNDHNIDTTLHPYNNVGLTLAQATNVERLPGFWQGACSVQDSAAQLAAPLLNIKEGQRVLDVCAAPGGKAAHVLESSPNSVTLTAIDIDKHRNQKVIDNYKRLNLDGSILTANGLKPETWFDGKPFQRILLDAPCSATGVIRRHPDIKTLRRPEDIANLISLQQQLLQSIWPLLDVNGMLLYATCSILTEENSQQVERFIQQQADADEIPIDAQWGRACYVGRQILPGEDNMDGFYYALITKLPKTP